MVGHGSSWLRWGLFSIFLAAAVLSVYRGGAALHFASLAEQCMSERSVRPGQREGLWEQQRFSLCLFLGSRYPESLRMESALKDVMALGAAPCEHVGIWKSARRQSVYRITMQDDNTFMAEPLADFSSPSGPETVTGYWGTNEGRMVWIYEQSTVWPPDINRIESQSPDRFTLIEVDGQRTEFVRERKLDTGRCANA